MIDSSESSLVLMEPLRPAADELDRRFPELRPGLVRVCASLVGAEEAEDAVQDAYVQARRSVGRLRELGSIEAWLYRIAVNECYRRHRRRKVRPSDSLDEATLAGRPEPAAPGAVLDLALRDLIERLPPRERVILVLHYGHGYGLDEIAALLGIKHATTRSIIARTRQALYRELTEAAR